MNEHTTNLLRLLREPMGEEVPPIQRWAADEIERLREALLEAWKVLDVVEPNHEVTERAFQVLEAVR